MDAFTVDILINTARLGDATSQHAFELARTLLSAGDDVRIVANRQIGPSPDDLRGRIQQIHPADYRPSRALTIVEYPLWHPLAERIRQAPGARIFWYHGVTDPTLRSDRTEMETLRNARTRTMLAWHAHLAIATSPFTATELQRCSNLPQDRIRIVPLGVNLHAFADPMRKRDTAELRKKLPLDGARVLLYVGRCAEHKRIDLMIDALAQLASGNEGTAIHLLVVGDTGSMVETRTLHASLRQQAVDLGVTDQVTFTGRVDEVEPYYQLADLYLQSSQHEGFGVPLVEAMAAGVPVVASASGAIPWVLGALDETNEPRIDGEMAGLLFKPGDARALAVQIQRLLNDRELYTQIQARGRKRAQAFSLERFQHNAVKAVAEAVEISRQGPPAMTNHDDPLYTAADVALRDYRVRSNAPAVGPLIEWTRTNATSHLREAYWDRMIEQQVNFNRQMAEQVILLRLRIDALRANLDALSPPHQPPDPTP